jgi:hypothetical protein
MSSVLVLFLRRRNEVCRYPSYVSWDSRGKICSRIAGCPLDRDFGEEFGRRTPGIRETLQQSA